MTAKNTSDIKVAIATLMDALELVAAIYADPKSVHTNFRAALADGKITIAIDQLRGPRTYICNILKDIEIKSQAVRDEDADRVERDNSQFGVGA